MASDARYRNHDWVSMESQTRRLWEAKGRSWKDFGESIRHGFESEAESQAAMTPSEESCRERILEITQRWVSDRVLDSAAATGRKQSLMSPRLERTGSPVRFKLGVGHGFIRHFGAPEWRVLFGVELFGQIPRRLSLVHQ
jgi:hypothetical protein